MAPSSVQHPAAGDGLWLRGDAKAGAIAALYPGILYPAAHHRYAPQLVGKDAPWQPAAQMRGFDVLWDLLPAFFAICTLRQPLAVLKLQLRLEGVKS